jgi:hypothetical protein
MENGYAPTIPKTSDDYHTNYEEWSSFVHSHGVRSLPGYTINVEYFIKHLPEACNAGLVSRKDMDECIKDITVGADLGLDEQQMPDGTQYRRNYKSALDNASAVTDALRKRVRSGKTLKLGAWSHKHDTFPTAKGCNVPNGAVAKKLEKDVVRPVSDHTKTAFNKAADADSVKHSLNTYNEIAEALEPGYFMRVEDVDGAFPVIPLAPRLWKYMYVHWYDVDRPLDEQSGPNTLYVHVFGDFGTSPLPGVWDRFFRCVKALARHANVLTLKMPHYVDDNSLIGPDRMQVDEEAERLAKFLDMLGVPFKSLKSRLAASVQLVLGFWWDSIARTRTLEAEKYALYLAHLEKAHDAKSLTLKDLQMLAGRMQRAALTMPPRALVYLSGLLSLMKGLKLPWHKRRVTGAVRRDLRMLIDALKTNGGRGYFAYDHFQRAPRVYTDAAKERTHAGGGFFSECGAFDYWTYGSSAQRQPIDYLEGDAVLRAAKLLGKTWKQKIVPISIDNTAFCYSLRKGRSKVERLNYILRQLFHLSVEHDCIFEPEWISTHDNIAADALSRGDLVRFHAYVAERYGGGVSLRRATY